jgi:hypothetical protein
MAEIGALLREARMRQRIDITEMESRTKIRAKYLRALENEEWDLLPGPTYVRSFLRTYAEALGLDAKLMVQEYKHRHDPLETGELHPIRRPSQRERDRRARQQRRSRAPRLALLGLVLVGIVVALYFLGREDAGEDGAADVAPVQTTTTPAGATDGDASRERRPEVVSLRIVPTGDVQACLVDRTGRVLLDDRALTRGNATRTFRSSRFRLVLSNRRARLRINGTSRSIPQSPDPVGYTITANGRSDLPERLRPDCGGA